MLYKYYIYYNNNSENKLKKNYEDKKNYNQIQFTSTKYVFSNDLHTRI